MPRNMQKSSFTTCRVRLSIMCLVGHIADKGVTWRRVGLAKKHLKKRKVGEGEGNFMENCLKKKEKEGKGKKGEKREHWRNNVKNGRSGGERGKEITREKGRLGSPEGRRLVSRYRKRRWNFACHATKTRKFEQSAHWFVTTNRPKWHLHRPRKPQMLITVRKPAHHCPKLRENASNHSKNDKLMSYN